jgi:hypothetical protein
MVIAVVMALVVAVLVAVTKVVMENQSHKNKKYGK